MDANCSYKGKKVAWLKLPWNKLSLVRFPFFVLTSSGVENHQRTRFVESPFLGKTLGLNNWLFLGTFQEKCSISYLCAFTAACQIEVGIQVFGTYSLKKMLAICHAAGLRAQ